MKKFTFSECPQKEALVNRAREIKKCKLAPFGKPLEIGNIASVLMDMKAEIRDGRKFSLNYFCKEYIAYRVIAIENICQAIILNCIELMMHYYNTEQIIKNIVIEKCFFGNKLPEHFEYINTDKLLPILEKIKNGYLPSLSGPESCYELIVFLNMLKDYLLGSPIPIANDFTESMYKTVKFDKNQFVSIYTIARKLDFNVSIHTFKITNYFNPFILTNKKSSDACINIFLNDEANEKFTKEVNIMYKREYAIKTIDLLYQPSMDELRKKIVNNPEEKINVALFDYSLKNASKSESDDWKRKIDAQGVISMGGIK